MKTSTNKTMTKAHGRWAVVALVASAALIFAACGKKSGDVATSPVGVLGCATCNFTPVTLAQVTSQFLAPNGNMLLSAALFGDASRNPQLYQMVPQSPDVLLAQYTGPVALQGTLSLPTSYVCGLVPGLVAPAGSYAVSTVTAASYQMNEFANMQIQAVGNGYTIQIGFPGIEQVNDLPATSGQWRITGNAQIISINGAPCNDAFGIF